MTAYQLKQAARHQIHSPVTCWLPVKAPTNISHLVTYTYPVLQRTVPMQVEARLHDKDEVLVSLQQSVQAMQRQQAQDRQDLNVSNTQRGQLEGQVASLTR